MQAPIFVYNASLIFKPIITSQPTRSRKATFTETNAFIE